MCPTSFFLLLLLFLVAAFHSFSLHCTYVTVNLGYQLISNVYTYAKVRSSLLFGHLQLMSYRSRLHVGECEHVEGPSGLAVSLSELATLAVVGFFDFLSFSFYVLKARHVPRVH